MMDETLATQTEHQRQSAFNISQLKLALPAGLANGSTGFMIWNAALVTRAFLFKQRLNEPCVSPLKVLDVSSGNGYLALTAASMGADCIATEFHLAYRLLHKNCEDNSEIISSSGGRMRTVEYKWGDPIDSLTPFFEGGLQVFDMVIFSDLLYIAFRDDIEDIFLNSILALVPADSPAEIVFCFERRKYEREEIFLARLLPFFEIEERDVVKEGLISACREDAFTGMEEDFELDIFYRDPPVRLLLLRRRHVQ
jgi:predicted nicotinamide N-methyase